MSKAIRLKRFSKLFLLLVLSPLFVSTGFGQISITDTRLFDVSFTDGDTQRTPAGIELSVHSPLVTSVTGSNERSRRFTSTPDYQRGSFFVETYGEISVGTYLHQQEDNILAQLPFRNNTSKSLDRLTLAFDFVYLQMASEKSHSYQLSYRVSDGEWIRPGGGSFSTDMLQATDSGWHSFSMQITLDQLFLRPGDTIDLRWSSSDISAYEEFLPVALQKIEIFPSEAPQKKIRPGSLIITELMPRHRTDRGFIEYVELYNSTENPINLKGLILEAGFDQVVIQHDLTVPSYNTVVIANFDGVDRFDEVADYKYTGTLLGGQTGRLETHFDGHEVARALFDAGEPGVAQQLGHLQNAYDGYSGMRYFASAREQWNNNFFGTPGVIPAGRKLYTKTIRSPGWHIFTTPGQLSASLNRDIADDLENIFSLGRERGSKPNIPYLYYHSGDAPVTLYSAAGTEEPVEEKQLKPVREIKLTTLDFAVSEPAALNRIVNAQGEHAFPAMLTWNSDSQKFDLLWRSEDKISPWDAVFVPEIPGLEYKTHLTEAPEADSRDGLTRLIELSLVEEAGSNRAASTYDSAVIGFWNAPGELENNRLDLPKIWAPLQENSDSRRAPMIYLKSADALHQTNSFIHNAHSPDDVIQVAVGVRLHQTSSRYRIEWDEIESIPDHWGLEFVDAELNETVDMRREHSYSFTERTDKISSGMRDPDLNFKKVDETDYSRFFVRVSSSGQLGMFERDDVSPESIELKQNYPNPFNPSTTVVFYLPNSTQVRMGVYNVVGQQVGVLVDDFLSAGEHTVIWNAMDMPSGIYIVQLEAGNTVKTRKNYTY
jgi:hypothetical protein